MALHAINRLWVQKGFGLHEDFQTRMSGDYAATLGEVDFAHPVGACDAINKWVEAETMGRLHAAFHMCSADDVLVLTNVIYFKGKWAGPFDKRTTKNLTFHAPSGSAFPVPTMRRTLSLPYAHVGGAQVVALPYRGGLQMIVVLPDAEQGLGELERELAERYDHWHEALNRIWEVEVYLPRWTAETSCDVTKALNQLGIHRAMSADADFSGVGPNLTLGATEHVAQVAVDEQGTEAAAATAVHIVLVREDDPPSHAVFRADHPFLYFIEDPETGAILFVGRVADPRGGSSTCAGASARAEVSPGSSRVPPRADDD
jgi:serpin B